MWGLHKQACDDGKLHLQKRNNMAALTKYSSHNINIGSVCLSRIATKSRKEPPPHKSFDGTRTYTRGTTFAIWFIHVLSRCLRRVSHHRRAVDVWPTLQLWWLRRLMGWSIDEINGRWKRWRNLWNEKYLYLTEYARFVPACILFPLAVKALRNMRSALYLFSVPIFPSRPCAAELRTRVCV